MNCNECRPMLDAYSDGELDLVRHVEIEAHLGECPDCSRLREAIAARKAGVRNSLPRFVAPQQLRERIHASLAAEARDADERRPARIPAAWRQWNLAGLAAAATVALLAGYAWGSHRSESASVLDEAFTEHVRSLQAGHLMDVVSTDRHTVKPWFAGKLDFSPPVADLADVGFTLDGGRLEEIGGRPAAALVFHRRLHAINVFVWPAPGAAQAPRRASENGYSAVGWTQQGLNFLAVSEIAPTDLEQFALEFRKRTQ